MTAESSVEPMVDTATLSGPILAGFAAWMTSRAEYARRTRQTYVERVSTYLSWIDQSGMYADALHGEPGRDRAVDDYIADVVARDRAPSTINVSLAALDVFYGWLGLGSPRAVTVADPQVVPRTLGQVECRALINAAAAAGPRAMAIVQLGLDVGPRESEIAALDVSALDLSEHPGAIDIADSVGEVRTVAIHPATRAALIAWLPIRQQLLGRERANTQPALFVSQRSPHGRLAVRTIDDIVRDIGAAAGLVLAPGTLRATAEQRELHAGTPPGAVAARFGQRVINRSRIQALLGGQPVPRKPLTNSEQLHLFGLGD
ncbi:tyrosine-type recombinase/integrase [Nocardia asteroides]|uniref:tyrosine-type recombinase/integrase n=1 Tax=Nocardia asteroides TaxID=1824 RepID=UPI001E50BAEA|nr:tyrosine-type recombinase/integrase [Nocardia asteroides]UGT58872.1 site-specific integrase [Nocardia asteroides]